MGGVIAFREDGEDTVGAYVVSANNYMLKQGFTNGMPILRGLRLNPAAGTRTFAAGRGEWFSLKHPDRKPGQSNGTAQWKSGALVFINTNTPGVVRLPPELLSRMGNYTDWVRADGLPE